jgi:Tfp pilus assembly major pilin PilA
MSFHELVSSYPWTAKRVIRVLDLRPKIPRRNPLAYLLALLVPYAGRMGAGLGLLIYVYLIGVIAAIAIPAYQTYTVRAVLTRAAIESQHARQQLASYYLSKQAIPQTLNEAGLPDELPNSVRLSLDPEHMVLTVHSGRVDLIFTPRKGSDGQIAWTCSAGSGLKAAELPPPCH